MKFYNFIISEKVLDITHITYFTVGSVPIDWCQACNIQYYSAKCNDNTLIYVHRKRRSGGVKEDAEESGQPSSKPRRTSVLQAIQNSNNHFLLLLLI